MVKPETEADRLRQEIAELRLSILMLNSSLPSLQVERSRYFPPFPSTRLIDLQVELARKEAELALLLRLEQRGARAQRGYAATDDAMARKVLAEEKGRTASLWELAKRHAHRLEGDGLQETKWRRMRLALRRVTGR